MTKCRSAAERPPDTRKHTVLPVSIRLKSTEKTPACVSMRAFLQPISARIYFGKTASHRKRARFVQSRGASPQAYWMSVKAAQRWGCAKRAFCGVCFLMPGGLKRGFFIVRFLPRCRGGRPCPPEQREALSFRASDRVTGVGIRSPYSAGIFRPFGTFFRPAASNRQATNLFKIFSYLSCCHFVTIYI